MELEELKRMLGLRPLPMEGGFYAESYRSDEQLPGNCLPQRYGGPRCFGTAIYFLLTAERFSALHRLTSDEVYHFYLGDPVEIFLLRGNGTGETITLGTDLRGMRPQVAVPCGVWQGSRVKPGGSYALLGTTVSPGFEFADFELANRESLLARYPDFSEMIQKLTRE
jgi:uncharacterized protein